MLEEARHKAREGHMTPMTEARAWALREMWREARKSDRGMLSYIGRKVVTYKEGGAGCHPSPSAISQFFAKVDGDPDWFPGKSGRTKSGPASVLTPTKQAAVARTAMNLKKRKREPTYANAVAQNRDALTNPETGEPVDKNMYYKILRHGCCDNPENEEDTWANMVVLSKNALTDVQILERYNWDVAMVAKKH